jgi:hypothetical protein
MPDNAVAKFVSECSQVKQRDPAKSIEIGPTTWLLGSPAPASDGMVGLATTPTQTVFFRREDILDARETEGRFLLNIAADTNLLVREEQVVRLNPGSCQCQERGEGIATRVGGTGTGAPNSGSIVIDCTPICTFETVCGPYRDPRTGSVIVVCWPKFVCRNPCEGTPA